MNRIYQRLAIAGLIEVKSIPHSKCVVVMMERHLSCGCKCVMTEDNCTYKQQFMDDRCACVCKNSFMGNSCMSIGKMWDPITCQCECPPNNFKCSTGAIYDYETCRWGNTFCYLLQKLIKFLLLRCKQLYQL